MPAAERNADQDRQLVITRHEEVLAADSAIEAAKAAKAALTQRRAGLDRRAEQHGYRRPVHRPGISEELAAAIAGDPSYVPDPARLAEATRQRNSAEDAIGAWKAEGELIEQAKPQIDRLIVAADADIAAAEAARAEVWEKFVREAHGFLIDELRAAIAPIAANIVAPLAALAVMERKVKQRQGGFPDARDIVSRHATKLSEGRIALVSFRPDSTGTGSSLQRETLLDLATLALHPDRAASAPALARFRASLVAEGE